MEDRTILTIAFISSLAGIFALYILAGNMDYENTSIAKINDEQLSQKVKLKGSVVNVRSGDGVTFVTLSERKEVDMVVFDNISVQKGEVLEVICQVDEYNGKPEIIAERIRAIESS